MIRITPNALDRLTEQQIRAISRLVAGKHDVYVATAFDLPTGYVSFTLTYDSGAYASGIIREANTIYGGISPAGETST